jgi:hypothetical protein
MPPEVSLCCLCSYFTQVILDSAEQYLNGTHPVLNGVNIPVNGANGHAAPSRPELLLFSANSLPSLDCKMDSFRQ